MASPNGTLLRASGAKYRANFSMPAAPAIGLASRTQFAENPLISEQPAVDRTFDVTLSRRTPTWSRSAPPVC